MTWFVITLANGTHEYTLSAALTGTWYTGATVNGATIQLTTNTGGLFNGSATISSGDTNISVVPEPGSLSLWALGS